MVQRSVPETQQWIKKYLRRLITGAMQSLQRRSPLDLASFTRHIKTKRDKIARIPARNLTFAHTFNEQSRICRMEAPLAKTLCFMGCLKLVRILWHHFSWHCERPAVGRTIDSWNATRVDSCHFTREETHQYQVTIALSPSFLRQGN